MVQTDPNPTSVDLEAQLSVLRQQVASLLRYETLQDTLIDILRSMAQPRDMQAMLRDVHQKLSRILDVRNFYIALYDSHRRQYEFPYYVDEKDLVTEHAPEKLKSGLTDYVRRTGRPLLLDEVQRRDMMATGEVELVGTPAPSWLGIPLRVPDGVIGVMTVQSYDHRITYSTRDMQVLQLVGDNIAMMVERQRREQELRKHRLHLEELVSERTRELEAANRRLREEVRVRQQSEALQTALYRIAAESSGALDLQSLFRAIHHIVNEWVDAQNFYIALCDREGQQVSFPYFVDVHDRLPEGQHIMGQGLTAYVLRTGRPLLATKEDLVALERAGKIRLQGALAAHWIGVPLQDEEGTFGVLVVQSYHSERYYTEQDKAFLIFVSQHIATALSRKRAEETLRASEKKYRTLFEESRDGICFIDRRGRFYELNPAGLDLFGYPGNDAFARIDQDTSFFMDAAARNKLIETLVAHQSVQDFELQLRRSDGNPASVLLTASAENNDTGEVVGFRGIIRDITEKQELERRVFQAQKLESLGLMAGGLAHDFNNILGAILGYASIVKNEISSDTPAWGHLETIERSAGRAADLIAQLLAFARGGQYDVKPLDLNRLVGESMGMIQPTFAKSIVLRTHLAPAAPIVEADENQIQQLLLNLCVNARDAIEDSGIITIRTEVRNIDASLAERHEVSPGRFAVLSVIDTGSGIPGHLLERIFDPFFTTKAKDRGTGLGLAMVYGVVKKHGGFIQVESAVGHGTHFRAFLPEAAHSATVAEARTPDRQVPGRGTETILVIDDEEDIRGVLQDMLELNGYRVLSVPNARQGLELFAARKEEIDLVILDMIMPGLGGAETFPRLLEVDSGVRVLLSSGYQEDEKVREMISKGVKGFIQKPYSMGKLTALVRRVLDGV